MNYDGIPTKVHNSLHQSTLHMLKQEAYTHIFLDNIIYFRIKNIIY